MSEDEREVIDRQASEIEDVVAQRDYARAHRDELEQQLEELRAAARQVLAAETMGALTTARMRLEGVVNGYAEAVPDAV